MDANLYAMMRLALTSKNVLLIATLYNEQFCDENEMIGRSGLTKQAECTNVLEHCFGWNEFKGTF